MGLKRKSMELKRRKREGRQSELDIFSIYQKGPVENKKRDNKEDKFNRNKNKNQNVTKNKKKFKKKKKQKKKKKKKKVVKKVEVVKISKSLQKKLTKTEQKKFIDKK